MRHVHHENSAYVFCHLGKAGKVDVQRIRAGAGDDELGFGLMGFTLHSVVVNSFIGVQAVADRVKPLSAHVERHTVGQVAPFGQAHAHDGVAGLEESQKYRDVG